jgi:hypothetical protein
VVGSKAYFPTVQTTTVNLASGAAGSISVNYANVVPSTTLVAATSAVQSFSYSSATGNDTVVVSDPNHTTAPGDVLTSGISSSAPNGFIIDVTSVTPNAGGTVTVVGTPGQISDAVPQGQFDITQSSSGVTTTSPTIATRTFNSLRPNLGTNTAQPTGILDGLSFNCNGKAALLSGNISFHPSVHLSAQWGGLLNPTSLASAKFAITGTAIANVSIGLQGTVNCTASLTVPGPPLPDIEFVVGPVPVVIVPQLSFDLSLTVSGTASYTAIVSQSVTFTAGLNYSNGSVTPVANDSHTFSTSGFTPQANGNASLGFEPKLVFLLYDAAGPNVGVTPYLDFKAGLNQTPWWVLSGGISGSVGFHIPIFNFDKSAQVFNASWPIAQATTSPPLYVGTSSLPGGSVGQSYSATLAAKNGTAPYTWSVSSGTLPAGLSLNSSTGVISGSPATSTSSSGTAITVEVTDAAGAHATITLMLVIASNSGALTVTTTSLPSATVGTSYSQSLTASGGSGTLTWTLSSGSLPSGLALSTQGTISGTPTTAGNSTFAVKVTDTGGDVTSANVTLDINAVGSLIWSAPTKIDSGSLTSISCPTATFCMGVDASGDAVTYQSGVWSTPVLVDSSGSLTSVSCPTSSFCMAVDGFAQAFTYQNGAWDGPTWILRGGGVSGVSCPTTSFCMAVGNIGVGSSYAVTYQSGVWSTPVLVDSINGPLISVSCPTASFCGAVGSTNLFTGEAFTYQSGVWSTPTYTPSSIGVIRSVSCPTIGFCVAVAASSVNSNTVTYQSGVWSTPVLVDSSGSLTSVSCPTSSFCIAVDAQNQFSVGGGGDAFTYQSGVWSTPVLIDSSRSLTSVSCPTSSFCIAVDSNGKALAARG